MKQIQLTINLKRIRSEHTALGIAEQAAEHLLETFNDDESLGKIRYEVVTIPKHGIEPALKARILDELREWQGECHEIMGNVLSEEEADCYDSKISRIAVLIEEVEKL